MLSQRKKRVFVQWNCVAVTAVRFADDCGPGSGRWCDFIRERSDGADGRRWGGGGGGGRSREEG